MFDFCPGNCNEPASAREDLLIHIAGLNASVCLERCSGRACADADAAEANNLIDELLREHAHELAEKIRTKADTFSDWDFTTRRDMRAAADLIDPEVPSV
ncbi:hypothetical protein [Streptomyces cyaneofuscatus]|uniref:hypothetical protein n=1 Tax=Streptomyces cyaneofuscatus TaxID=66883 RepID=UPI0034486C5E